MTVRERKSGPSNRGRTIIRWENASVNLRIQDLQDANRDLDNPPQEVSLSSRQAKYRIARLEMEREEEEYSPSRGAVTWRSA